MVFFRARRLAALTDPARYETDAREAPQKSSKVLKSTKYDHVGISYPRGQVVPAVTPAFRARGVRVHLPSRRRSLVRRGYTAISAVPVRIVAWALAFRLVSALLAWFVALTFPLASPEPFTIFGTTNRFWDAFARFDTGHFQSIAWAGYAPAAGGRSNIAYFPVYPLLTRMVGRLFGRSHATYYLSAIGISWVCFALAMVVLYRLARLD